ncbi:hypothetical protein N7449_004215 [Penicillium cf. viridicatum]|uniref:NACHT domain-containing protein n=1 Tax=Penicillium cf. viridicatum TaxID=2972119 RepID=A0A9W9MYG4_9EURO|nr:hypothetical protein N7449_004215 [Penicillium cf. viridicatum]
MDPLSITAGSVGFLSLGIQVFGYLFDFYSAYRHREEDLAKIINRLEDLLCIFKCLDSALQSGLPSTDALSRELDKVVVSCNEIIEEIQAKCERFQKDADTSLKNALYVRGLRMSYPFRKRTLRALEVELSEMRGNLSFALDIVQLENHRNVGEGVRSLKLLLERTNAIQISSAVRDWLRAPDATVDHSLACAKSHAQTGLWFLKSRQFQDWLVTNGSFLWINGFPGCGKSVLMSTTIQHTICAKQHQYGVGVAFFYFCFADASKRDSYGMLSALLLQLSTQGEGGEKDLEQLYESYKTKTPPLNALLESLRLTLSRFSESYLFIDALDESLEGPGRDTVLSMIRRIRQWDVPSFHLLVSSRDEFDIRQSLETSEDQDISIRNEDTQCDILNFVAYELESDPKLRRWHRRHEEIREKLAKQSEGIFRFVACQLSSLRMVLIGNQLDECLRSLPRDLDETYERMLCGIDDLYVEDARRALTALCISDRPLTIAELIGAIAVNFDEPPHLDYEGRSYTPDDLIGICRSLIEPTVTKDCYGQRIVAARIAHFSVQQYLQSDRILQQKAKGFAVQEERAHAEMAQTCLIYLLDPNLSAEMSGETRIAQFPFVEYAAEKWLHHYERTTEKRPRLEALILRLFQTKASFAAWVSRHDVDMDPSILVPFPQERLFDQLAPAVYYAAFLGLEKVLEVFMKAEGNRTLRYDSLNHSMGTYGCPLQAASFKGHQGVVHMLLEQGADPNIQGGEFETALQAASYKGCENIVQMLLERGADPNIQGGEFGTALRVASSKGYENIVQMLLERGADVSLGAVDSNALLAASSMGHESCVQLLLQKGADVNIQLGRNGTSLLAASYRGFENIVKVLLEKGAKINALGGQGGTALQAASSKGHGKVVQMLLDEGADPNVQGGVFGNALQAASSIGCENVVRILLEGGVDPNAQGGKYGCALQAASARGHEWTVRMLLQKNADVNLRGGRYGNALQAACLGGREKIVRMLLKKGADVNSQGGKFGNALQAACYGGNEDIVQRLLEKGADVNAPGGEYGNALQAASNQGHESLVHLLLEKGADVNAQGGVCGNALQAALSEGFLEIHQIVDMLLTNGADVNARGGDFGSALQAASYHGYEDIVQILLERGADVKAQGGMYDSAIDVALSEGHEEIVQILLRKGARPS